MFAVEYDETLGIVRCRVRKPFSVFSVQSAAEQAKAAINRCRAENGDVKALVVCDTEVQHGEVMDASVRQRAKMSGQFDRMAFIFPSSVAKAEVSQYFNPDREKAFLSENAAITWLLADRGNARPQALRKPKAG
jgi:hypothetical protein